MLPVTAENYNRNKKKQMKYKDPEEHEKFGKLGNMKNVKDLQNENWNFPSIPILRQIVCRLLLLRNQCHGDR
jgi:hypothetical protein